MPALIAPLSACQAARRGAAAPNALQAGLEVRDRALHRALDRRLDKPAVERSAQAWPRLELDREAVLESIAGGREATFMAYVRPTPAARWCTR
jgi:hypothetical protein